MYNSQSNLQREKKKRMKKEENKNGTGGSERMR